jgi:putative heme-binding domain-containing protein
VLRLSDAQISHIIENGVPGTGMPAFHSLAHPDVQAVVAYLRFLQGAKSALKLPGDPDRGETIFFGKAGCSGCHMAAGKGGFIASDLSGYAHSHAVEQIRSAITSPGAGNDRQSRLVTATTRGGEKYVGRIRNEDNFSLQLQSLDGTFFFVEKSDLVGLDSSQTLMPSDYGSTLSSSELNDVISYLMRVANVNPGEAVVQTDGFEDP